VITDEQKARDYAQLAGLDLAEVEAAAEELISAHWPLVRALAEALVERKVVSARRARQILFAAYRKELRRWRTVAEQDRRNQQGCAAVLRTAPSAGWPDTATSRRKTRRGCPVRQARRSGWHRRRRVTPSADAKHRLFLRAWMMPR
jgi:hypothetical protein